MAPRYGPYGGETTSQSFDNFSKSASRNGRSKKMVKTQGAITNALNVAKALAKDPASDAKAKLLTYAVDKVSNTLVDQGQKNIDNAVYTLRTQASALGGAVQKRIDGALGRRDPNLGRLKFLEPVKPSNMPDQRVVGRKPNRKRPEPKLKTKRGVRATARPENGPKRGNGAVLARRNIVRQSRATFRGGVGGSVIVSHREFLTDVVGTNEISVSELPINPGMHSMFPWLSTLAQNYDRYLVMDLSVEFVPLVPSTSRGRLWMGYRHDAAYPKPNNKFELSALPGTTSGNIWTKSNIRIGKMATKGDKIHYVRAGMHANTDIKTYDCGKFYWATDACDEVITMGELYVKYTFKLLDPVSAPSHSMRFVASATTGQTPSAPFGTAGVTASGVGAYHIGASGEWIVFEVPGQYIVSVSIFGTAFSAIVVGGTAETITELSSVSDAPAGTAVEGTWSLVIKNPGQYLQLSTSGVTVTSCKAVIARAPSSDATQVPQFD